MGDRGCQRLSGKYPFRLHDMPGACRRLAQKILMSGTPIAPTDSGKGVKRRISAADAAASLEAQASRWEHEIKTGIPNERDRRAIGEWDE